jgi:hypothetical protein
LLGVGVGAGERAAGVGAGEKAAGAHGEERQKREPARGLQ